MVKIMHILFIWGLYRRVIYRRGLTKNMVTLFVLSLLKELLLLLIFYKQTIEPEKPQRKSFFFTWVSPISKNKCCKLPTMRQERLRSYLFWHFPWIHFSLTFILSKWIWYLFLLFCHLAKFRHLNWLGKVRIFGVALLVSFNIFSMKSSQYFKDVLPACWENYPPLCKSLANSFSWS